MFYYTYLVIPTNKKSHLFGTVYFGQHSTNNLNDGYIASGKQIIRYLKKYPGEYYREIIQYYSSAEELNKAEYELIHPHLNKKYCLNLVEGGFFGHLADEVIQKNRKKISNTLKKLWETPEYREHMCQKQKRKNTIWKWLESFR